MKFKWMSLTVWPLMLLSGATLLTACQSHLPVSSTYTAKTTEPQVSLQDYIWSYQPKDSSKPIVLTFHQDRLGIHAGCNGMGASLAITAHTLKTGPVMGTMMACEPDIMKQERFAAALFENSTLKFNINAEHQQHPVLTLITAQKVHYQFVGQPTAEHQYQGQAEIIFLEVSPEMKACTGVALQQCLYVREIHYDAQGLKKATGEWTLLYAPIEGFQHDPKQRTILRVKRFTLKNPAADQSQYVYIKDMVVEQQRLDL